MDKHKEGIKIAIDALSKKIDSMSDEEYLKMYQNLFTDGSFEILSDIFENYFEKFEGRSCCVDKGRMVARTLIQATKELKHLPLQYTYREYRDRGGDLGNIPDINLDKMCYWCSALIPTTKEAINVYYRCITAIKREIK